MPPPTENPSVPFSCCEREDPSHCGLNGLGHWFLSSRYLPLPLRSTPAVQVPPALGTPYKLIPLLGLCRQPVPFPLSNLESPNRPSPMCPGKPSLISRPTHLRQLEPTFSFVVLVTVMLHFPPLMNICYPVRSYAAQKLALCLPALYRALVVHTHRWGNDRAG